MAFQAFPSSESSHESSKSHFTSKVVYPVLRRNTWNGPNQGSYLRGLVSKVLLHQKSPPIFQAGKWQWSRYLLEMAHADTTTYDEAGMSHIFVEVGKGGIRDMCYICVYTRTPREKSGKYVSPEERNRASTITSEWRAAYGAKKRILMHFRSRCSR